MLLKRKNISLRNTENETYPFNVFLNVILGLEKDTEEYKEAESKYKKDPTFIVLFDYVLNKNCTQREVDAVHFYFRDGLTLEKTGGKLNVCRERIRQIIERACRRLQNPACKEVLTLGLDKYITQREELAWKNGFARGQEDKEMDIKLRSLNIEEIKDLHLSVRTYNCLSRAGYYTVKDIMLNLTPEKLARIRNMGNKSYIEVVEALEKVGFDMSEYKNRLPYKAYT